MSRRRSICRLLLAASALGLADTGGAQAPVPGPEVVFAYQSMLLPWRALMESGELERSTGYRIRWQPFGTGGDVIRAMATGDVQIGEAGSGSVAAAMSQGQDIRLFWILSDMADAEALVARKGSGIESLADLRGKRVAVPALSTAHYQLMAGLKLEGLNERSVRIVHHRPPEIAAAWERGDIDAAFVWDPVLSHLKAGGTVLATSGSLGRKGYPTFDGLIVHARWAAQHEAFLVALVKAIARADADYRDNAARWTADSPQVQAVAKWSGADPAHVPGTMALYRFPSLSEQASAAWLGGGAARALADTAAFWQRQGRVLSVKPDYGPYVTVHYVQKALGP